MKSTPSARPGAEAPAPCRALAKALSDSGIPDPMSPWQISGFAAGLVCGLGPGPELAFDAAEDPERILALDCLDELSRRIEDHDAGADIEALLDGAAGQDLAERLVALVAATEGQLAQQAGHPALAFADPAAQAQDPTLADVPAARAYARGLLRGLVMAVEDDDALAGEVYGEPLSLIFILTEDDLGSDFGTAAEVAEARRAVATAMPGLVAQLWAISHGDDSEE